MHSNAQHSNAHSNAFAFVNKPDGHQIEGPTAFNVSSKRHRQSGVNEIGQVFKWWQLESNHRTLARQSCALTTQPLLLQFSSEQSYMLRKAVSVKHMGPDSLRVKLVSSVL